MARIISTRDLKALVDNHELSEAGRLHVYCCLDSAVTREVWDEQEQSADRSPETELIYKFEMAQQVVALDMMLRGLRVDRYEQKLVLDSLQAKMDRVKEVLNRLANMAWGRDLNPMSPVQQKDFFYKFMGLPPNWSRDKGESKLTVNEEALRKLGNYFYAKPYVNCILRYKEFHALAKVLRAGVDSDGRMRFSFNVGGTSTGRWSSSKNVANYGTNAQNLTPEVRGMFVADKGWKLANLDLERAESFGVGYLSGDENYIAACLSSDIHTAVAKMIWKNLPWTGDEVKNRALCEELMFDPLHSYRFMSKTSGHAKNYRESPFAHAIRLRITRALAEQFERDYYSTFPGIPLWHLDVQKVLQDCATLYTPMGRRRVFFERLDDDSTLRKAIAHLPQSLIADILNFGLLRIWHHMVKASLPIRLLLQVHDSILFGYPEGREDLVERARELLKVPIKIGERIMTIPVEAKVGYNWRDLAPLGSAKARAQVPSTLEGMSLLARTM